MPSFDCAAILFDLDGVLVDSREAVENAWRDWALQRSLDPARVLAIAHGHRTADTIRTEAAPKPVGAYPHARRVGNLLFVSSAYNGGARVLKLTRSGTKTDVQQLWHNHVLWWN